MRLENNIIITDDTPPKESCEGGIGHILFKFMKKHRIEIAEIDAQTGQEETYELLLKKCIRTSIILQNKGVTKGDAIVIYCKMGLCSSVSIISCFFIGALPTFLDIELASFEMVNIIKQSNPKLILTSTKMLEPFQKLLKDEMIDVVCEIVIFDQNYNIQQEKEEEFKPYYVKDLKDIAMIPFSSGSTGFPKGICLSHYAILRRNLVNTDHHWLKNKMKVSLTYDSYYWSVETERLITGVYNGVCRLVDPELFEPKRVWYYLDKYKVNLAYFMPYFIMEMYNAGKPTNVDLTNLKTIILTGAKLSPEYHMHLQKLLPTVDVFILYGQTETGALTEFNKCDLHRKFNREKPGSVGVPVNGFGISLKIVDINTGEALGPNKPGELRVKKDSLMSGYYNLDNSDQFDEDGWFRTGDEVLYDEDLCFFIVDRIKDMIIYQGRHISPVFLEEQLLIHPAVKRAAVIGVPHETDGEHPMALIVLKDNMDDITPGDIEQYVAQSVPELFQLKAGVKVLDESYFAVSRKVKRYFLKKLVLSGKI